jgi:hypothetical protein
VGSLANVPGGKAGKPGPLGEQVVEVMGGHELGARLPVHVDELGEDELDPPLVHDLANLIGVGGHAR